MYEFRKNIRKWEFLFSVSTLCFDFYFIYLFICNIGLGLGFKVFFLFHWLSFVFTPLYIFDRKWGLEVLHLRYGCC